MSCCAALLDNGATLTPSKKGSFSSFPSFPLFLPPFFLPSEFIYFFTAKLTPIHIAARRGDLKCLRLLIDHGADVTLANKVFFLSFYSYSHSSSFFFCCLTLFFLGRSHCPSNGSCGRFFKCPFTIN